MLTIIPYLTGHLLFYSCSQAPEEEKDPKKEIVEFNQTAENSSNQILNNENSKLLKQESKINDPNFFDSNFSDFTSQIKLPNHNITLSITRDLDDKIYFSAQKINENDQKEVQLEYGHCKLSKTDQKWSCFPKLEEHNTSNFTQINSSQENKTTLEKFSGYHLHADINSEGEIFLKDKYFKTLKVWKHGKKPRSMPYLLRDGSLIYPYVTDNITMPMGGSGGGVSKFNWQGELLWNIEINDNLYQQHHDIEPLPNGNILVLAWEAIDIAEAYKLGRNKPTDKQEENTIGKVWSETILELKPEATGKIARPYKKEEIVWKWRLWDHLVQTTDPNKENYVEKISQAPERLDINLASIGIKALNSNDTPNNGDWMHANAIDYNPLLDQIVLSSRAFSEIYIIDHSTTSKEAASRRGGRSNKGGDFLYRWGNPGNYNEEFQDSTADCAKSPAVSGKKTKNVFYRHLILLTG